MAEAVAMVYWASSAIPYTAPATAKNSATSRKVMHRHHFACSLPQPAAEPISGTG